MCITENKQYVNSVPISVWKYGSCVNVYLHSVSTPIQRDEHTHTLDARNYQQMFRQRIETFKNNKSVRKPNYGKPKVYHLYL